MEALPTLRENAAHASARAVERPLRHPPADHDRKRKEKSPNGKGILASKKLHTIEVSPVSLEQARENCNYSAEL